MLRSASSGNYPILSIFILVLYYSLTRVRSYLLDEHKQLYIGAVKCLHNLPSQIDPSIMPGARSRYDDFTATHLLQTPYIHFNGLFLAFHRYYLHLFEQALRDECGYSGPTPYFDWSQWYKDPTKSELLNGSSTSFGGNGKYVPYRDPIVVNIPGGDTLTFPPATGGGCIETGPFVDFQMHLGPVVLDPQGPLNGTGYNPRCITRDISTVVSDHLRPSNITKLLDTSSFTEFNNMIDLSLGLHTSAHFMIGGIQMDPFASPSDPYFWPHHGMIDYLWTVWQGQDLPKRPQQVTGTEIIGNRKTSLLSPFCLPVPIC